MVHHWLMNHLFYMHIHPVCFPLTLVYELEGLKELSLVYPKSVYTSITEPDSCVQSLQYDLAINSECV